MSPFLVRSKSQGLFGLFKSLLAGVRQPISQPYLDREFNPSCVPQHTEFPGGKRVLLMVDDDNMRLSAARHGCLVDYARLAHALRSRATRSLDSRAVLTSAWNDHRDDDRLLAAGFETLRLNRTRVPAVGGGTRVVGNDTDLVWEISRLVARRPYDTIVLATGDGDLAVCVANGVRRTMKPIRVITLSIAGSVSRRIRPSELFQECVMLGRDLLVPSGLQPIHGEKTRFCRPSNTLGLQPIRPSQHRFDARRSVNVRSTCQ
jgi:uncharacterized LabA/DUF88 family protein